jgi:hypothetical protein
VPHIIRILLEDVGKSREAEVEMLSLVHLSINNCKASMFLHIVL